MKNKLLLGVQILLVVLWGIASYSLDNGSSINLAVFNILPIPNFALVLVTGVLLGVGYWLQGLKNNK